jgi:hypothetical protein
MAGEMGRSSTGTVGEKDTVRKPVDLIGSANFFLNRRNKNE